MFADWNAVSVLSLAQLRRLLWQGDSVERVWAAWALVARLGPGSRRDLDDVLATADAPSGLRRQVVVLLAGLFELDALADVAASDPEQRVRVTALQYLTRLVRPGDVAIYRQLIAILDRGDVPARSAVLAELRADCPPRAAELCGRALWDARLELRAAAGYTLLRWAEPEFPDLLCEPAMLEPHAPLREQLATEWARRAGPEEFVAASRRWAPAVAARARRAVVVATSNPATALVLWDSTTS